jgi:hypothetical protein
MSAIVYAKPMPVGHRCTPLHVGGVIRHTCDDLFWQPISQLTPAGAR